jgi:hypothetical protein
MKLSPANRRLRAKQVKRARTFIDREKQAAAVRESGLRAVASGQLAEARKVPKTFSPEEIERRSRAGRKLHRQGKGIFSLSKEERRAISLRGGNTNSESGQIQELGRTRGKENAESGFLDKIRSTAGSVQGGKTAGPINGRKCAENGTLARALHIRWHVRGTTTKFGDEVSPRPNPRCDFCIQENLIIAFA